MTKKIKAMITNAKPKTTRRRFISLLAASTALSLSPSTLNNLTHEANAAGKTGIKKLTWRGILLGAEASLTIYSEKQETIQNDIQDLLQNIKRLESFFSLYQEASLINKLNQQGELKDPPFEFYELMNICQKISDKTKGAFDPTIQPLFIAYKALAKSELISDWQNHPSIKKAKTLINWQKLEVKKSHIRLGQPQMAVTLNGIAQGYITEQAANLLTQKGYKHTLVNFGEYYAIGQKPDLQAWRIQLGNKMNRTMRLEDKESLAASSRAGMVLNQNSGLHHLLNPRTGQNQPDWQEIYVKSKSATLADAYTTALFAMNETEAKNCLKSKSIKKAVLLKSNRELLTK